MDSNLQVGIAQRITAQLKAQGKSQNWLAGRLEVPQSTFNRRMNTGAMTVEEVMGAAAVLGVPLLHLLEGDAAAGEDSVTEERANAGDGGSGAEAAWEDNVEREAWALANTIADPLLRILERESITAMVRAQAVRRAARAAEREQRTEAPMMPLQAPPEPKARPKEETGT